MNDLDEDLTAIIAHQAEVIDDLRGEREDLIEHLLGTAYQVDDRDMEILRIKRRQPQNITTTQDKWKAKYCKAQA